MPKKRPEPVGKDGWVPTAGLTGQGRLTELRRRVAVEQGQAAAELLKEKRVESGKRLEDVEALRLARSDKAARERDQYKVSPAIAHHCPSAALPPSHFGRCFSRTGARRCKNINTGEHWRRSSSRRIGRGGLPRRRSGPSSSKPGGSWCAALLVAAGQGSRDGEGREGG